MKMFNQGAQYGTLNTCRSAITLIIRDHVGIDISIKRFFKGISRLLPSLPRYDTTWDPNIVFNFLENVYRHENIPLELISTILRCYYHPLDSVLKLPKTARIGSD